MGRNFTLIEAAEKDGKTPIELITEAVKETGSVNQAAKRLGVNRNTVLYHLERAGLRVETTMKPTARVVRAN